VISVSEKNATYSGLMYGLFYNELVLATVV